MGGRGGRTEDRGLGQGWERAEKGRVGVRAGEGAVGQMEVLINKAIHYPGDSGRISTGKAANFYITKLIPIKKIYMCSQETSWLERRVHDTHICRKIILLHKYQIDKYLVEGELPSAACVPICQSAPFAVSTCHSA